MAAMKIEKISPKTARALTGLPAIKSGRTSLAAWGSFGSDNTPSSILPSGKAAIIAWLARWPILEFRHSGLIYQRSIRFAGGIIGDWRSVPLRLSMFSQKA
jgi:hypothetical protein